MGPRAWQEWNVNELTDNDNFDEISGFPVYKALLCNVAKVEGATETTRRQAHKTVTMCEPCLVHPQADRQTPKNRVYLDNAATTRIAHAVRDAMRPCFEVAQGNPSSIHGGGRDAAEAIAEARRSLAKLVNARPRRIIFTGSGSEANNMAIKGVALPLDAQGRHIITSSIEHPSVLQPGYFLENLGYRLTYLEVDQHGLIHPDTLQSALTNDTVLVSIMLANNEVGTIQPIRELCGIAHEHGALFHCDAVQAIGKITVDVQDLDVDMLTISGHKFYGPKGVGALFLKKGIRLEPLIHGGKQESGFRAGTENVPAIVGLGKAAELARGNLDAAERMRALRDRLEAGIRALIPQARLNGHRDRRLPSILNLTLPGLRGESIVVAMDLYGIALSSGSACKAGSPEPTHVLIAMGKSTEEAHCSVRFSLSHDLSETDIDDTVTALKHVLREMETTVRFLPCK